MIAVQIIILIILLALSGFFSSAETALTTVSHIKIRTMANQGDSRAKMVQKVTSNTPKMLSAVLIGNNIVNISASSLATVIFMNLFGSSGAGIATGIMTFLVLIFGEITPKNMASRQSLKLSLRVAGIIYAITVVLTPAIFVVNHICGFIMKIAGADKDDKKSRMTEAEFRTIVDVGNESGAIENEEKDYINNLFDFSDTEVREIMIPRIDATMINVNWSYSKVRSVFMEKMYTRIPVYDTDTDHVIGILNMKDLIKRKDGEQFSLKSYLREPFFTFEFKNADELFNQMRKGHIHMAIVLDEFGSVSGIVTLEDLLEELVGNIQDEYDGREAPEFTEDGPGEYTVLGSMNLDDLSDKLGLKLESEDYDTIGGYLLGLFDHLPRKGESYVTKEGVIFTASDVRHRRIVKVKIKIPQKEESRGETEKD
ncbi:MAG: HlyC/CorC family transporter [Lachnospiraceae bacterium]|uniref:HlyC/CorC family transporter n=1 Tax=Candidatus Weimeria bifida TaxID=2599074 RepID=A0A6N7IZS6_9FIRM|nr:HlyC/CorC family transporter [Candidatus Weimeria bifida]RRF96489.1 MAG: HlyC/CorC family transporter [Lachnospiraceae bacterium]